MIHRESGVRSTVRPTLGLFAVFLLAASIPPHHCIGQDIIPRILNGEETDDYESVGIVGDTLGGFCSGTLIGPRFVLTAAHCAEEIGDPTDGTFEVGGEVYATVRITVHPNYNARTLANDLAIMELVADVPDIETSRIFTGVPRVGDELILVGFGSGGDADSGADGTFGTKRVGTTTIDRVDATTIGWEFDDPSESNTTFGDSGGPAFIEVEGQLFIAGITSGGTEQDSGLGDMAFDTRVDAYAQWITDVISTEVPDDEPDDESDGDDDQMGCFGNGSGWGFGGWQDRFGFRGGFLFWGLRWLILDILNELGIDVDSDTAGDDPPDDSPAVSTSETSVAQSANRRGRPKPPRRPQRRRGTGGRKR